MGPATWRMRKTLSLCKSLGLYRDPRNTYGDLTRLRTFNYKNQNFCKGKMFSLTRQVSGSSGILCIRKHINEFYKLNFFVSTIQYIYFTKIICWRHILRLSTSAFWNSHQTLTFKLIFLPFPRVLRINRFLLYRITSWPREVVLVEAPVGTWTFFVPNGTFLYPIELFYAQTIRRP